VSAQQEKPAIPSRPPNRAAETRTELLNELRLRSALVDLENAKDAHDRYESEYRDAERLIKQNIIAQKDLDDAWSRYNQAKQVWKQAEIKLEETKLNFLANATHITIMEAKKYYDRENKRMLDLVLKNTSNLAQAESALGLGEDETNTEGRWEDPNQIRALLDIENIIVSIVSKASSIGKPYEEILPVLPYGGQEKLTFELLTDVVEVGVKLSYLDQSVTEQVYLEKESLQAIPTVISAQFSQEGQLGTMIQYSLGLEMLVTSDRSFSLLVTNLPPQISYSFIESEGTARLTSVRFTEEVSKHDLALALFIPQTLSVEMIDQPIDFQAWVVTTEQAEMLNGLSKQYANQTIPIEELDSIKAGRADLGLIPKGAGLLDILINNAWAEVNPQQDVQFDAELHNDGSLSLFDIIPEITSPIGWTAEVSPKSIKRLLPAEKLRIQIHLRSSDDVDVGEYESILEARGQSGGEVVEALERRLKIRVSAKVSMMTTLMLIGGLVVVVGGIVFVGVKLSRR
jgi:hypothetical protein